MKITSDRQSAFAAMPCTYMYIITRPGHTILATTTTSQQCCVSSARKVAAAAEAEQACRESIINNNNASCYEFPVSRALKPPSPSRAVCGSIEDLHQLRTFGLTRGHIIFIMSSSSVPRRPTDVEVNVRRQKRPPRRRAARHGWRHRRPP